MNIKSIGKYFGHQDGAIYGGFMFRFDSSGECAVYRTSELLNGAKEVARFFLDKKEIIVPHSNSVSFGSEKFDNNDEFPLLYCNVYNNYKNADDKLLGATCVYRIIRNGNNFSTTLVQIIQVGFTEDTLWKSQNVGDVRPFGNIAIDRENSVYYAFTMRDEDKCTRFFAFDLPKLSDGELDKKYGVNKVILNKEDIKSTFDSNYCKYMQGACFHKGIIYSVEGFTNTPSAPPVIRAFDVNLKKQIFEYDFREYDMYIETEFIDFENDTCYYADDGGNHFILKF